MEDARLRSLTERRQSEPNRLQSDGAGRIAGVPALLPSDPPQYPPQQAVNASSAGIPKAEITDAFVAMDGTNRTQEPQLRPAGMTANQSSQVPLAYDARTNADSPPVVINAQWNTLDQQSQPPQWNPADQEAQAPKWNPLPEPWPQITPGVSSSASAAICNCTSQFRARGAGDSGEGRPRAVLTVGGSKGGRDRHGRRSGRDVPHLAARVAGDSNLSTGAADAGRTIPGIAAVQFPTSEPAPIQSGPPTADAKRRRPLVGQ